MTKKFAIVLALFVISIVCCAGCIGPGDNEDPEIPDVPDVPDVPVTPVDPVDPVVPTEEYSVMFMLNYGDAGAYTAETVKAGETVSKPASPTRSGYTFNGWFTAAEGGAAYDFTQPVNADVTLYAQWKKKSSGSSHSHSYTTLVETVEATCGADGHNVYKCSCGQTKTETIPAIGQHPSVELSGGKVICSVCKTPILAQIGTTYYSSFATAMKKATESDTITLLADVSEEGQVDKAVTIYCNESAINLIYTDVAHIKINESTSINLGTVKLNGETVYFQVDADDKKVADTYGNLIVAYTKEGSTYTVYTDYGLKQALTAEDANIVVNLANDLTYEVAAWQNNAIGGGSTQTIKINGDDHILSFNLCDSDWAHVTTVNDDAKLILNNMDLERTGYNSGHWKRLAIHFNCSVEMNSVKAESVGFKNDAILKDLQLTRTDDAYSLWIHANGQTVELIDSKIDAGRGIKIADEDADGGLVTLKVSNSEFITKSKSAILVTSTDGANIQINGIDIDSVTADSTNAVWVDEDRAAYYDLVTVTGGTKILEGGDKMLLKDGTYYIATKDAMFDFANTVNIGGKTLEGNTVKLVCDIDLNNDEWTPIGQTGATKFKGVFDGQGHTISNLTIDSSAQKGGRYSSGLFGWIESHAQGITIKNVNVDGATVKGHHNVAVIAGYLEGDSTVENCHVSNAELTNTHANGDACGDKTGVIAGYVAGTVTIKDCTATDCTLEIDGRDAGQLLGASYVTPSGESSATNVIVSVMRPLTCNDGSAGKNIRAELIGRVLSS